MKNNLATVAVVIAVLIILFPLGYSLVWPMVSQGTEPEPFLDLPEGQCVAETSYMRYRHMELLKEVREEAVREEGKRGRVGINGVEITIGNCVKCHGGQEHFCNRCHAAVNLQVNCFRCHYDEGATESQGND